MHMTTKKEFTLKKKSGIPTIKLPASWSGLLVCKRFIKYACWQWVIMIIKTGSREENIQVFSYTSIHFVIQSQQMIGNLIWKQIAQESTL